MVNVHDVIIIFKLFNEKSHKLDIFLSVKRYVVRRNLGLFCRKQCISRRLDSVLYRIKVVGLGVYLENLSLCGKILSACLKRGFHKLILVDITVFVRNNDKSLLATEIRHATRLTHISVVL